MPNRRGVPQDPPLTAGTIEHFVRVRAGAVLAPREAERFGAYLLDLHQRGGRLPAIGRGFRWDLIAERCGLDPLRLSAARRSLAPIVVRLHAHLAARRGGARPAPRRPAATRLFPFEAPRSAPPASDPEAFREAFAEGLRAHGQTVHDLARALAERGCRAWPSTLDSWARGERAPTSAASFATVAAVERLWRMWPGDLAGHLPRLRGVGWEDVRPTAGGFERSLLKWHLPDDFAQLDAAAQEEILAWVDTTILRGGTAYRRFVTATLRHPFSIRFPGIHPQGRSAQEGRQAPPALAAEMAGLIAFKTAPLTPAGFVRSTLWGSETAGLKADHLSLLFGALAAAPDSPAAGRGVPLRRLGFGLLVFPAVWEWYLEWRRLRRGFHNGWERDTLLTVGTLTRAATGWMTQSPALALRLQPIAGLVSAGDIAQAQSDWAAACGRMNAYARERARDLRRVARVHNNRFEAVRTVLEADQPVAVYNRIAEAIRAERVCARRQPRAAAESTRGFLMIRLALHLGFRQRNLRELLFSPPGAPFRSAQHLHDLRRGELRWHDAEQAWEVFAPASAFKNAHSSFFAGRPYWQRLEDLGGLYAEIAAWLAVHRPHLVRDHPDPGTFFVKRPRQRGGDAALTGDQFHGVWWRLIQRYGVFNPYTGRGAVAGLLPHGPHNVRDILATHILKQTGSFEQASYAIQDVPETIARHYGRFLPQDKVGIAAALINQVWAQPDRSDGG